MELARRKLLPVIGCLLVAGAAAMVMVAAKRCSSSHETPVARPSSPAAPEARSVVRQPGSRPERIERSQLPFVLLGTFAATDPSLSRATLRHRESQQTIVVRVSDEIEGRAFVARIERERVLLREGGSLRELRLDSARAASDASRAATGEEPGAPGAPPAEESPFEAMIADLERSMLDTTANLALVVPEVAGEKLVGLHFSEIRKGSGFAQMGIQEGDVITQFNGVPIDSPFVALHALREMMEGSRYHVMVRRGGANTELSGEWDVPGS